MSRRDVSFIPRSFLLAVFSLLAWTAGCTRSDGAGPSDDPLAGLEQAVRTDSNATSPPDTATPGPGRIVGTVFGIDIGADYDTVGTAVALAGVAVTAYERDGSGVSVVAGEKRAETVTDASGHFALPPLPAGEYVVTFVPPPSLPYRASWTVGQAWSGSADNGWYIMLRKN